MSPVPPTIATLLAGLDDDTLVTLTLRSGLEITACYAGTGKGGIVQMWSGDGDDIDDVWIQISEVVAFRTKRGPNGALRMMPHKGGFKLMMADL